MTTKDQERQALEQIKKILEGLGEDSYLGKAFEGCLEIAESNIDNDFFDSMQERFTSEANRTHAAEERLRKESALRHKAEAKVAALEGLTIPDKDSQIKSWKDSYYKINEKVREMRQADIDKENRVKALEQEVLKLKAKLYDYMTA